MVAAKSRLRFVSEPSFLFHGRLAYLPADYFFGDQYGGTVADAVARGAIVVAIENHALLAVGSTIEEAFLRAYMFEQACELQLRMDPAAPELTEPEELYHARSYTGWAGGYSGELEWPGLVRQHDRDVASGRAPPFEYLPDHPHTDRDMDPASMRGSPPGVMKRTAALDTEGAAAVAAVTGGVPAGSGADAAAGQVDNVTGAGAGTGGSGSASGADDVAAGAGAGAGTGAAAAAAAVSAGKACAEPEPALADGDAHGDGPIIDVRPLEHGPFGAEVSGVTIAGLDAAVVAELEAALWKHKLLVLRGAGRGAPLAPAAFSAFAASFGKLATRFGAGLTYPALPGLPALHQIEFNSTRPPHLAVWHADHSWQRVPTDIEFLLAQVMPSAGGDTLFADAALAWQTLPAPLRKMLAGTNCTHAIAHGYPEADFGADLIAKLNKDHPATSHPCGIHHPFSGEQVLYTSSSFTFGMDGLNPAQAAAVLGVLNQHISVEAHRVRVSWNANDVLIFDNLALQHFAAADYFPETRRILHASRVGTLGIDAARDRTHPTSQEPGII